MGYGDYPDLLAVKKILVIKMRQLGDVLLTGPVFQVLKTRMPQAKIDAYIYTEALPMLEGHPAVSSFIGYDREWKKRGIFFRLGREWELWRKIRQEGYDLVINLTEGDRGVLAALVSGARIRVGFDPKGSWQKKCYTHRVKHVSGLRHVVERNLDALRRIGIFPEENERELFLRVEEFSRVRELGKYVLIHPTSRWKFKCLPILTMRRLAEGLIQRGKKVVFTSGPDPEERAMVDQIVSGLDVVNLSGKVTLKELGALIQGSELLICVDTLAFHMASALKKPVVAIFGPTSEVNWGPWKNPSARVVSKAMSCRPCYKDGCGGSKLSDCLFTLEVESIFKAVDDLLIDAEILPKVGAARLRMAD